ncbi:MAG TPA: SRPBCC family protein [Candidatus Dormibacteraeota bacterium]|nr:SRPBCC family protein [Candidatus Dormibacteraeota bacterium]
MDRRLVIARPQAEVYDYVANLENLTQYIGPIRKIHRMTTPELRAGTRLTIDAHFLGIRFSQRAECTEHARPRTFVARSVGGRFFFEAGFELHTRDGGTVLEGWGRADAPRLFGFAENILGFFVERQIDGDLKKLKKVLELEE